MRIVQLIDSLEAGGAERMAVNYANTLLSYTKFSGLVVTRKEGLLKDKVKSDVGYLFLNRKKTLDFKAILSLRNFLIANKVTHIQAHSSSFFMAVIAKIFIPDLKIIWHDHYGKAEQLNDRSYFLLKLFSLFFYRIISVNQILKNWAEQKLWCSKVTYLPNFVMFEKEIEDPFELKGVEGKRIICLANLRPQKNHDMLIDIAYEIAQEFPEWSFHFVGQDNNDDCSQKIRDKIREFELEDNVFIYGSVSSVQTVVEQCQIGVLSSVSEGLPLTLLEYGKASLPVVVTAVGEIPSIINENNGFCVSSGDKYAFSQGLKQLINDEILRRKLGEHLKNKVETEFGVKNIMANFISFVNHGRTSI
ncbi:glycosyltransferase [Flavobacterium sp. H122]|uniref:glycosyltransferase n=1 Tax=Flavobacterium sp. H122 TaxID=2529860 RepID=UPI0010A9F67C|nr:glycosyltransferase [Flavobacterium sp. H122]